MKRRTIESREYVTVVEELKRSGTWVVPEGCTEVEVWMIGGGGAGGSGVADNGPDGFGGGSGYVQTGIVSVNSGESISYTIGNGGKRNQEASAGISNGSNTVFKSLIAKGGHGGGNRLSVQRGGNGNSGGGDNYELGGINGSDGVGYRGGSGAGVSEICPFNNKQYGGGGSGATKVASVHPNAGLGGKVGGPLATDAKPNTGAGGGGGYGRNDTGGAGGSGIIVLRYKKYK